MRDMAMAFSFGAAPEIAAFMVAYRLANLFRRLFGESNLQGGFIPHFEELRGEDPKRAFLFYRDTAFSLTILLIVCVGGIEAFLWAFARVYGGDFGSIANLAMWMAPGLLFICLSALNSALLQCQKRYFGPAAASALFNFVWIGGALASRQMDLWLAAQWMSLSVTFGFALQWVATAQMARGEVRSYVSALEWLQPQVFSAEWKRIVAPMALGILGVGAMQINSALDALFARLADPSGPAYLWYAIRVQQLPLALFGVALSGALLPPLSRAMKEGAFERYRELLIAALKRASLLMVPCMFGLFALGCSGLNLIYGRGDFNSGALRETVLCLWGYGIGLVPAVFVLILSAGFYARKNYGGATKASLYAVAANGALNAFFVFGLHWGAVSIALATSASALLNCALLMKRDVFKEIAAPLARLALAGAGSSCIAILFGSVWLGDPTLAICKGEEALFVRTFWSQAVEFCSMSALFIGAFLGLSWALRLSEVFSLFIRPIFRKLR
jgi:putative peptidoglycan lipid II flippase